MTRIENLPIKDYQKENEFLPKLNELTKHPGYIGNNINQITIAIHNLKSSGEINLGGLKEFNNLMRQYLESRTELSENLQKIFLNKYGF